MLLRLKNENKGSRLKQNHRNAPALINRSFDVNRKATPIGTLPKPTNLTAKAGDNFGSLEISWDVIQGAYVYEIEYTDSPRTETSKATHISTSKHKCMIDGQKRGQATSVLVPGVGSDPRRVWSGSFLWIHRIFIPCFRLA